jgi:hypothetical protein
MQSAAAESQQIRDKFPFEPERVRSFITHCVVVLIDI